MQDSLDDEPRVFFDPNTLSTDGTIHLSDIEFSEDGELVALGLSSDGSDWVTVRFRNTSSGKDYPEILEDVKFTNIVWSKDGRGVFYAVRSLQYNQDEINYAYALLFFSVLSKIGNGFDEDIIGNGNDSVW